MKTARLLVVMASLVVAGIAPAGDAPSTHNVRISPQAQTPWTTDPKYWESTLREPKEYRDLRIGRSDFVIRGPFVDALRRRRPSSDPSPGRRFLRLPVVRLFVPQPMPSPPGGGRYFLWGEGSRPWSTLAEGAAAGDLSNPVTREARPLFWISR